jgi:pectate lyase
MRTKKAFLDTRALVVKIHRSVLVLLTSVFLMLVVSTGTSCQSETASDEGAASLTSPFDRPFEGFGAHTEGGLNGRPYVVISLADAGRGTLRDALSESNRHITFAIGGTITLASKLRITSHHLTIDGTTAPPPGITLAGGTLLFVSTAPDTAHDIVLRNIRITDGYDNLAIGHGARNIVIDHCSFRRAGDGNIDIYDRAENITVQWCILGANQKNSLIRDRCRNISLHHNLYANGVERNPQIQDDCMVVDMVNNVIFNWGGNYGTRFRKRSTGNLIANYYLAGKDSDVTDAVLLTEDTEVFSEGNVIPRHSDDKGTADTRWEASPITMMSAKDALISVLDEAGAFPRDDDDKSYVREARKAAF